MASVQAPVGVAQPVMLIPPVALAAAGDSGLRWAATLTGLPPLLPPVTSAPLMVPLTLSTPSTVCAAVLVVTR